jgi:hypothetical protein
VKFILSWISLFDSVFSVLSCCAWSYALSMNLRISATISFPRSECCWNFVFTADFDMQSSNFFSKSWNSKYRLWKPSANPPPTIKIMVSHGGLQKAQINYFADLNETYISCIKHNRACVQKVV